MAAVKVIGCDIVFGSNAPPQTEEIAEQLLPPPSSPLIQRLRNCLSFLSDTPLTVCRCVSVNVCVAVSASAVSFTTTRHSCFDVGRSSFMLHEPISSSTQTMSCFT